MNPTDLLKPTERRPSKAYLANEIRRAVKKIRGQIL